MGFVNSKKTPSIAYPDHDDTRDLVSSCPDQLTGRYHVKMSNAVTLQSSTVLLLLMVGEHNDAVLPWRLPWSCFVASKIC